MALWIYGEGLQLLATTSPEYYLLLQVEEEKLQANLNPFVELEVGAVFNPEAPFTSG